jgi:hypothetical protein
MPGNNGSKSTPSLVFLDLPAEQIRSQYVDPGAPPPVAAALGAKVAGGQKFDIGYQARRLAVRVDAPFDDFRQRYEAAVPAYDVRAFDSLVERKAPWSEVLDLMNRSAPHGFLTYSRIDTQPMMSLAGHPARCVEYLMGNHTIAERMFRYDPTAMLYAPLRTVIADDAGAGTRFSIEQPSCLLASFGNEEIAAVGVELDRKVAALLVHLDAPVPPPLLTSS